MNNVTDNAKRQADAQMRSIREMVAALECDYDLLNELRESDGTLTDWHDGGAEQLATLEEEAGDCVDRDDAERRILEDALSVEVRSDWVDLSEAVRDGCAAIGASEFRIVLCTGGPHVQIRGELSQGEPSRAWLEYQGWGTPMTERVNLAGDQDALLAYARCFYFGE